MAKFGTYKGRDVQRYTIENARGTRLSVLDFGGIWQEFSVLDGGERVNLLLASDDLAGYTQNPFYINRVIGRTAGRIDGGRVGNTQIPGNEGENVLHGGMHGLSEQFFDVTVDANKIQLTTQMTRAIDGFSGTLDVTVTYTLSDEDAVTISFTGKQSEADGVFNPTSHVYFNLGDTADVTAHDLWVNSTQHLAVRADKIPTGEFVANAGSAFDLEKQSDLGGALAELADTAEGGFDDIFVVTGPKIAVLRDRKSGRQITLESTRNGLVVFTGNSFTADMALNHGAGHAWEAVALEAQTLPNSMNLPQFGDVTLRAGETVTHEIIYRYTKDD